MACGENRPEMLTELGSVETSWGVSCVGSSECGKGSEVWSTFV